MELEGDHGSCFCRVFLCGQRKIEVNKICNDVTISRVECNEIYMLIENVCSVMIKNLMYRYADFYARERSTTLEHRGCLGKGFLIWD